MSASTAPVSSPLGLAASLQATQPRSGTPATVVESTELLKGQKSVAIQHNGALYRLQATRLGKLILTK